MRLTTLSPMLDFAIYHISAYLLEPEMSMQHYDICAKAIEVRERDAVLMVQLCAAACEIFSLVDGSFSSRIEYA